jgi:hypothetical protein
MTIKTNEVIEITIINPVKVALMMLESACETMGLADALEPNHAEDKAVARYLRVLAQDEADMACTTVRNGVY